MTRRGLAAPANVNPGTANVHFAGNTRLTPNQDVPWNISSLTFDNVSNNFKMELAYRYLNFGNVNTGIIDCAGGGCSTGGGPRA